MSKQSNKDIAETILHFKNEENELKINFSISDIKLFLPITENQSKLEELYKQNYNIICDGVAGVGKTFCILNLALEELLKNDSIYEKIVIVRSAVSTRDIGFLPGTEEEKMAVFEKPYESIFKEIFTKKDVNAYKALKKNNQVEFLSTSHIRGITLNNTLIVVDEVENLNFHEIDSVLTRVGRNSKIFLCGDYGQTDLIKSNHDKTGILTLKEIAKNIDSMDTISFDENDIVRSGFVKDYYLAKIKYERELKN